DVTSVTTRPMITGIMESSSATTKPAANKAMNRPFAWRAKCQKNAMKPGGGSATPGVSVGFRSRSKNENMACKLENGRPRGGACTATQYDPTNLSERAVPVVPLRDRMMAGAGGGGKPDVAGSLG